MSLSENDGDNVFIRRFQQHQTKPKAQPVPKRTNTSTPETAEEFSPAVSWPILLAVIPTLGAFVAGSAEIWSDFIMLVLILYYVYKWMTGKYFTNTTRYRNELIHFIKLLGHTMKVLVVEELFISTLQLKKRKLVFQALEKTKPTLTVCNQNTKSES